MQSQQSKPATDLTPDRAPYRAPKLVRYGQLSSLTQSGGPSDVTEDSTFAPNSFA